MNVSTRSVITSHGTQLWLDDQNPLRVYFLPTHLDVAVDDSNSARFNLLFYQTDDEERGARLVMTLAPQFPTVDVEEAADAIGTTKVNEVEILPMPFGRGEVEIRWPDEPTTAQPVHSIIHGQIHVEMSFTQAQASRLRTLLKADEDSVQISTRLVYNLITPSLPVIAQVDMKETARALQNQVQSDTLLTGLRLRTLLEETGPAAIDFEVDDEASSWSRSELMQKSLPALAPLVAEQIADLDNQGITFDESIFQLRGEDEIEPLELRLALAYPQPWNQAWRGDWSLSDFIQQVEEEGKRDEYVSEVLHVPLVGNAQVLVENLLTLTDETVRAVNVELRHRKIGSLEKEVVSWRFTPDSPPVVRHQVPVLLLTPFGYEYSVQLEVAPSLPGGQPEYIPPQPAWQESDQPLVEIGPDYLPYIWVYAAAEAGVFERIGFALIEFASREDAEAEPLAAARLTANNSKAWLLIRSPEVKSSQLFWRAKFFPDAASEGNPVVGEWQPTDGYSAIVSLWTVYPRTPIRVQLEVIKGLTPTIQSVTVELSSGTDSEPPAKADRTVSFTHSASQQIALWPKSIFEEGFRYRSGAVLAGGHTQWMPWQQGKGGVVHVNAEEDFYVQRSIDVSLDAPWAEGRSPDPSSKDGKVIFAEVHLQVLNSAYTQSTTFTFDRDNEGTHFQWRFRGPASMDGYTYSVHLLSEDGGFHKLGPFDSMQEQLVLEIFRELVSDTSPPKFGVREGSNR